MKNAMYYFKDTFYPGGAEGTRLRDGQGHQLRGQDADCGRGESQVAGVSGRGQQQGERADHTDCQREGYDSGAVPGRRLNNMKSDRTERR